MSNPTVRNYTTNLGNHRFADKYNPLSLYSSHVPNAWTSLARCRYNSAVSRSWLHDQRHFSRGIEVRLQNTRVIDRDTRPSKAQYTLDTAGFRSFLRIKEIQNPTNGLRAPMSNTTISHLVLYWSPNKE